MKVFIYTLGCKVNQYESDVLANELEKMGFEVLDKVGFADIFIINSCAITNEAERKSRQAVTKLFKYNPQSKVFVIGCASQKESKQFLNNKNVCYVGGTANKIKLAQIINQKINDKKQELNNRQFISCDERSKEERKEQVIKNKDKNKNIINSQLSILNSQFFNLPTEFEKTEFSKPSKVRAFVKIQDGCNNFCSYCIIPYLRGRSRSRNFEDIIDEVKSLQGKVKEIVLTGIDVSSYCDKEKKLADVILALNFFEGRIRISSFEAGLITKEFLEIIKNLKNFCPHFHLSLQSGSDKVLKDMNRHYTTAQFFDCVKLIRKYYEIPAITTDLIVGYPTETEEEFERTCEFVRSVRFANLHIFPFSKREGTVASKLKLIDGNIIKKRLNILESIKKECEENFLKLNDGKELTVLVEEIKNGTAIGYTENYIKCKIKGDFKINEFVSGKFDFTSKNFIT